jgi:glycosyltransferase involved in cell wall biosynthesis
MLSCGGCIWHSVGLAAAVRKPVGSLPDDVRQIPQGKPRVMQLVLSLSPGGTERLVIEIVRSLTARTDSIVCCLDEPGGWADELTALGVPVLSLSRTPGFHPSLAVRLSRLMKERGIDVVHCHHYSPYVYGSLAAMMTRGVRVVFTEHGKLSDHGPSRKRRLVNPILSRLPGRVCAVSSDLRDHMVAEGFPRDRVHVHYNGIAPGEPPTPHARQLVRQSLGIPDTAFVVGTAGRLDPVKNLSLLVEAHRRLRTIVADPRTVIVGDGPERASLEREAARLEVADSIIFAGYRGDVRSVMAAFDVYVNCSTYEGVSLTILEAMATGLPVVATRVGGTPEVVVDGETGRLVSGSAHDIAGTIAAFAEDPPRARAMGNAGRARVVRHFSLARMVEEYAQIYLGSRHSAIATPPASAPAAAEPMSVSDATRSIV